MKLFISIFTTFLSFASCAQPAKQDYSSPNGYDLERPEKFTLPHILQEISGIAFHQGQPDTIYAQQDEDGKIFRFRPGDKKILNTKFGKKGDYEDIAIYNSSVVMLRSDGTLYTFPLKSINGKEITDTKEWKNLLPKGEYESLAAHMGSLFILCKKCKADKKTDQTSGYVFQLSDNGAIKANGTFHIQEQEIEKKADLKGKRFRPSAMTKNNRTNEWYILSSINKMLVVTDETWKVKAVYPLNPKTFNQPEGMSFDRDHNLYISNEGGGKSRAATLLKFKYLQ
ncbi:SdiA-regulated domain-containing protein [Olivibacter sp. SDN3]|uniref:SdiA-regulated domain-containing protein n=1 Tax=Olivibacter sp. SDN3 TaxID=2764720 RepID=UPI001651AAF0|nr:SdiA-regulated domain-containing protein [Olivibacter sp. SDN3]QNL50503.1 SdiA-regulated domain-containing protein [Olivibacter sp. SDN3]